MILKGRLSSFGFSGTITHGMFSEDRKGTLVSERAELQSSVRGKVSVYRSTQVREGDESAAAQKLVGFHGVTPGKELASMEVACGDEEYLHCEACPRSLGQERKQRGAACCVVLTVSGKQGGLGRGLVRGCCWAGGVSVAEQAEARVLKRARVMASQPGLPGITTMRR